MIRDATWRTVVIAASGPSLTVEQCAIATAAQQTGRCRIIVINSTWRLLPGADALYAADGRWWDTYIRDVRAGFAGELWTQDEPAAPKHGLNYIRSVRGAGLPVETDRICRGSNSGYQAMSLAYRFGARKIVLIGYDMQRTGGRSHHHGDHPRPLINGNPSSFVEHFPPLAKALAGADVAVVNASLATALACFSRGDLAAALASDV
jgi:hypothetical protein